MGHNGPYINIYPSFWQFEERKKLTSQEGIRFATITEKCGKAIGILMFNDSLSPK
jgi:hypothetical protein